MAERSGMQAAIPAADQLVDSMGRQAKSRRCLLDDYLYFRYVKKSIVAGSVISIGERNFIEMKPGFLAVARQPVGSSNAFVPPAHDHGFYQATTFGPYRFLATMCSRLFQ